MRTLTEKLQAVTTDFEEWDSIICDCTSEDDWYAMTVEQRAAIAKPILQRKQAQRDAWSLRIFNELWLHCQDKYEAARYSSHPAYANALYDEAMAICEHSGYQRDTTKQWDKNALAFFQVFEDRMQLERERDAQNAAQFRAAVETFPW